MHDFETIQVRYNDGICFIQIHRPDARNTINGKLIEEFSHALEAYERDMKILVIEGLPEVFCFGADFNNIQENYDNPGVGGSPNPEPMYELWLKLAKGPFISIAHIRGQANAGGIGFVSACDIVICEEKSTFSLSELLFGLIPACVLPFLIRRIGFSKANYMTLMTEPISAKRALEWGLVDDLAEDSQDLLRKKLLRLRRLSKTGITRYKHYMNSLDNNVEDARGRALQANIEVFSDSENIEKIATYVRTGRFPWEKT